MQTLIIDEPNPVVVPQRQTALRVPDNSLGPGRDNSTVGTDGICKLIVYRSTEKTSCSNTLTSTIRDVEDFTM